MKLSKNVLSFILMSLVLSCGNSSKDGSNACNGKNVCLTSKVTSNNPGLFNLNGSLFNTYYKNALSGGGFNILGLYLGNWDGTKCTFPVTVFENSGVLTSYSGDVVIGGGDVEPGSYDCIAIKLKNWGSAETNSNAQGACAGWEGQILTTGVTPEDLNGNVITSPTKDTSIYIYFRIGGQVTGNPFIPSEGGALNANTSSINIGDEMTTLSFNLVTNSAYNDGTPMSVLDLKEYGTEERTCTFADDQQGFQVDQE